MEGIHPPGEVDGDAVTASMCTPDSLDPRMPTEFAWPASTGEIAIGQDLKDEAEDSDRMEDSPYLSNRVPQDSEGMRPYGMSDMQRDMMEHEGDSNHTQSPHLPTNAISLEDASQQPMTPAPEQQDLGDPPAIAPQSEEPQQGNNAGAPTDVPEGVWMYLSRDGSVNALAYSADGRYVASGSEDTTIIIWDAIDVTPVPPADEAGQTDIVTALAFSRDNIYLASASHEEQLIIWAVANGRVHRVIPLEHAIHSLAYTPDGQYLVAGAGDGALMLWDAHTHNLVMKLTRSTAAVTFIIFSPDGSLMATGGTESVCQIWKTADIAGGEPLSVLTGHRGMVCAAAFSNDNRRIITASDDGSSRIWNALTAEALVILYEHGGPVWTVAFSPDGKRVASGSGDCTVKVCDSYTGDRQLSLEGHDSIINAVKFSPDGKYIASAASDDTMRVWSALDGTNQATFKAHKDNVTTLMFARDGSTLVSSSHDTVRIRPLVPADD